MVDQNIEVVAVEPAVTEGQAEVVKVAVDKNAYFQKIGERVVNAAAIVVRANPDANILELHVGFVARIKNAQGEDTVLNSFMPAGTLVNPAKDTEDFLIKVIAPNKS